MYILIHQIVFMVHLTKWACLICKILHRIRVCGTCRWVSLTKAPITTNGVERNHLSTCQRLLGEMSPDLFKPIWPPGLSLQKTVNYVDLKIPSLHFGLP